MKIIVFALVVILRGEDVETTTSYWANLRHCLNDARLLSVKQENFYNIQAWCKPIYIDPSTVKINGGNK